MNSGDQSPVDLWRRRGQKDMMKKPGGRIKVTWKMSYSFVPCSVSWKYLMGDLLTCLKPVFTLFSTWDFAISVRGEEGTERRGGVKGKKQQRGSSLWKS